MSALRQSTSMFCSGSGHGMVYPGAPRTTRATDGPAGAPGRRGNGYYR